MWLLSLSQTGFAGEIQYDKDASKASTAFISSVELELNSLDYRTACLDSFDTLPAKRDMASEKSVKFTVRILIPVN